MMIHTCNPNDFGRNSDQLVQAYRNLDKSSPFYEPFQKQALLDDLLKTKPSGPSEINGTGPAPSPRTIMERALVKNDEKLFNHVAKQFNVDEKTQLFIKCKAYCKYSNIEDKLVMFCHKVSPKMPVASFAEICFNAGKIQAAAQLVAKIKNEDERLNKFIQFKMYKEAASLAQSLNRMDILNELKDKIQ